MSAGRQAADAILNADPDGGAGDPDLIRRAADAAQEHGDLEYAEELRNDAAAWDRYLGALAQQMQERRGQ